MRVPLYCYGTSSISLLFTEYILCSFSPVLFSFIHSLSLSHAASPVIPHPERLPGQWILGKDACLVRGTDWVHAAGSGLVWV